MTVLEHDAVDAAQLTPDIERFDLTERLVHWTTAVLLLCLIATGATLYLPALSLLVRHRALVENVHVWSGVALLVPLVLGVAGPWRAHLVADIRRFDTWVRADFDWFHRPARRRGLLRGKFNGGQKLEAAFLASAMAGALITGLIMRWAPSSWINWATGATLVHDTLLLAITAAVVGHLYYALSSPDQLIAMVRGRISRRWAREHAPAWLAELDGTDAGGHVPAAAPAAADQMRT